MINFIVEYVLCIHFDDLFLTETNKHVTIKCFHGFNLADLLPWVLAGTLEGGALMGTAKPPQIGTILADYSVGWHLGTNFFYQHLRLIS